MEQRDASCRTRIWTKVQECEPHIFLDNENDLIENEKDGDDNVSSAQMRYNGWGHVCAI